MDCGGKGRVATDIATYECSIYRVENEHDVVIEPRLQYAVIVYNPENSPGLCYHLCIFDIGKRESDLLFVEGLAVHFGERGCLYVILSSSTGIPAEVAQSRKVFDDSTPMRVPLRKLSLRPSRGRLTHGSPSTISGVPNDLLQLSQERPSP